MNHSTLPTWLRVSSEPRGRITQPQESQKLADGEHEQAGTLSVISYYIYSKYPHCTVL